MIFLEKLSHIPEILDGKPADAGKFPLQVACQGLNDGLSPAFGVLTLDDDPADIPIQPNQLLVDRAQSGVLGCPDALLDLGESRGVVPGRLSSPVWSWNGWWSVAFLALIFSDPRKSS